MLLSSVLIHTISQPAQKSSKYFTFVERATFSNSCRRIIRVSRAGSSSCMIIYKFCSGKKKKKKTGNEKVEFRFFSSLDARLVGQHLATVNFAGIFIQMSWLVRPCVIIHVSYEILSLNLHEPRESAILFEELCLEFSWHLPWHTKKTEVSARDESSERNSPISFDSRWKSEPSETRGRIARHVTFEFSRSRGIST